MCPAILNRYTTLYPYSKPFNMHKYWDSFLMHQRNNLFPKHFQETLLLGEWICKKTFPFRRNYFPYISGNDLRGRTWKEPYYVITLTIFPWNLCKKFCLYSVTERSASKLEHLLVTWHSTPFAIDKFCFFFSLLKYSSATTGLDNSTGEARVRNFLAAAQYTVNSIIIHGKTRAQVYYV